MSAPARYRKLYSRIWRDPAFRAFPAAEKLVALYVLTGPQTNRVGLFHFSIATAAEELELPPDVVQQSLAVVCRAFGWTFDASTRLVYLPCWFRWNPPENRNVLIGALKDLQELPVSPLLEQFARTIQFLPRTLHGTFAKGFQERSPKRSPIQEQEQEHEQEHQQEHLQDQHPDRDHDPAPAPKSMTLPGTECRPPPAPTPEAFEHYHTRFVARYAAKPEYGSTSDSRNKYAGNMARLLKKHGLDEVKRRLDAYFDAPDAFLRQSGHSLGLFFSGDVQTKLIANLSGVSTAGAVSSKTAESLAARDRVIARMQQRGGSLS